MTYKEEFISYLKNTFGNLDAEYSEETHVQSTLFWNAIELSKSRNQNERVLSIVLCHQSSIELMKRLIVYSNFLVKLLVYPSEIKFKKIKDNDSYSTIINALENHISFEKKESLLNQIRKLNKVRTKVSHYFFKEDFEIFSFEEANKNSQLFESIFKTFEIGILDLGNKIKSAKSRKELTELLSNDEQN
ncbi:hypothetical protein [Hyunsoonleella pacifica]|uniref:Uncharacterized protein n=1 Tax=Hyunsoonleella pacifica TaxID=1080224 RepID=A0A4Q9FLD0_9FLAO|nr:hypothetical protein [Hyunsoonleella pacifica]TBN13889.1 hypothetical protein EYD46_15475 [Hyunsoonleella pacifica]GGD26566.1 hypothetical protein GCM10011368_30700 [Hyunsoonleella pacifica]